MEWKRPFGGTPAETLGLNIAVLESPGVETMSPQQGIKVGAIYTGRICRIGNTTFVGSK